MTGPQITAIRKRLGLTLYAWGQVLGYEGDRNTIQASIGRLERSDSIPERTARLAWMLDRHGVPTTWLPRSNNA